MAENPEKKDEPVIDEELARAQKSMGGRMDPDPTPAPKVETPEPPKKDITPEPTPAVPPKEEPKVEEKNPDGTPKVTPPATEPPAQPVKRPQAYIPMPKYLSEKEQWEKDHTDLEAARAKITELESLSHKKDGVEKDEAIEAFMAETGFDRTTAEGFLKLAEKKLLKPEQLEALGTAEKIVKEAQIEEAFNTEFTKFGEPELKKRFPNATDDQLLEAKKFLDQTAHTAEYHDKALDFIIYKHGDAIAKLFEAETPAPADPAPQSKKTIEPSRTGAGKVTNITAKDFEGQTDFSSLADMDPAERSQLIKDMPEKTYRAFQTWVAGQTPGVEVMRNGQKVILK